MNEIASIFFSQPLGKAFLVLLVLQFLLFICFVFFLRTYLALRRQTRLFLRGKTGADLEEMLIRQGKELHAIDQEIQELFEISNRLRELSLRSIHKSGVLRFNPFKEVGSNQSFSVALLDGKNSGVVISSLHTREGTRVYAKPIVNGEPDGFPLTDEEKKVITEAILGKPAAF